VGKGDWATANDNKKSLTVESRRRHLFQRLPGELAKQLLMSGSGSGGGHDVAAALRKAVAFCERKFCEANLPSADNADEIADLEGARVYGTGTRWDLDKVL
jgi:hypothetical protein